MVISMPESLFQLMHILGCWLCKRHWNHLRDQYVKPIYVESCQMGSIHCFIRTGMDSPPGYCEDCSPVSLVQCYSMPAPMILQLLVAMKCCPDIVAGLHLKMPAAITLHLMVAMNCCPEIVAGLHLKMPAAITLHLVVAMKCCCPGTVAGLQGRLANRLKSNPECPIKCSGLSASWDVDEYNFQANKSVQGQQMEANRCLTAEGRMLP